MSVRTLSINLIHERAKLAGHVSLGSAPLDLSEQRKASLDVAAVLEPRP